MPSFYDPKISNRDAHRRVRLMIAALGFLALAIWGVKGLLA